MFANLSPQVRQIVLASELEARRLGHNWIGTEHLLLALLSQRESSTAELVGILGLTQEKMGEIHAGVNEIVGCGQLAEPDPGALGAIGIDLDLVRRRVEAVFGPGALGRTKAAAAASSKPARRRVRRLRPRRRSDTGEIRFTPRAKRALESSLREALSFGGRRIEPEYLLLALMRERDGVASRLLERAGVHYESARHKILRERGNTG